ncbi:hypothetical protein BD779DRAFT_1089960 [Infundibulicybe gibba]|nr:hypothetical protein BD779DRAFT_1089960 [Infundibulicybe gibba]
MPCPNCHCPSCLALDGSPIPSTEFSPPPSELVTTNRAPTSLEVADSRNIINSARKAIQSIQAMIDDLEERKSELLNLISTHKAAISPLRSFPPELLAEIFAQFISMIPHSDDTISPPLMFMGICSQWRQIVLDTPRLWTKILTAHPMIDYWVGRSGALPLHVDLNFICPDSYSAQEALILHSHRWERVNLSISSDSNSDLARVKTRLDSLKYLSLYPGNTNGTIDFCEVAPQLTEIKLMEFFEPVVIKLPWEQLEVCTLDNAEIIHYALRHAKNLRALHDSAPWMCGGTAPSLRWALTPSHQSLFRPFEHSKFLSTRLIFIRTWTVFTAPKLKPIEQKQHPFWPDFLNDPAHISAR